MIVVKGLEPLAVPVGHMTANLLKGETRMQNEPIGESHATPFEPAFAAALTFVGHLQKLTDLAKDYSPASPIAAPNPSLGLEYAGAFLAWLDLSYLLTQRVRVRARLIHEGSPVIRLSPQSDAAESVIAAVERDLGGAIRLIRYPDQDCPFVVSAEQAFEDLLLQRARRDPPEEVHLDEYYKLPEVETRDQVRNRLGLSTRADEFCFLVKEWIGMDAVRSQQALAAIRGFPFDLKEIAVLLTREGDAVKHAGIDQESNPPTPKFSHADDFTWIIWNGEKFAFTKGVQSRSIEALWKSWEKSGRRDGCGMGLEAIAIACGSNDRDFRIQKLFAGHPILGKVLRSTEKKGVFALYAGIPGK